MKEKCEFYLRKFFTLFLQFSPTLKIIKEIKKENVNDK